MVNTETSVSAPIPLATIVPSPTSYPAQALESYASVREVDHFVIIMNTLTMGEPTLSSVLTKRACEEEQQYPRTDCSPKRTRVIEDNASREVTPFIKIPNIFSFRLPRTPKEVISIVPTSNLSFAQNLPEGDKMELDSLLAHNMFKDGTNFSLVSGGWGYVLAPGNSSKETNTWKGKAEEIEVKCSNL